MASNVTLHDLIEALADAIIGAQDKVERYQTSNVRTYFDERSRPLTINIPVHSLRADAKAGEEDLLVVPLLSLVSASRLAIKDVEIAMEVRLGSLIPLTEQEPSLKSGEPQKGNAQRKGTQSAESWPTRAPEKALSLDLGAPRMRDRAPVAKVTLRVENQEPTEGMARLLMELNKRIGVR